MNFFMQFSKINHVFWKFLDFTPYEHIFGLRKFPRLLIKPIVKIFLCKVLIFVYWISFPHNHINSLKNIRLPSIITSNNYVST